LEFEDECTEHVIATEESKKLEDFVVEAKKSGLSIVPALVKRMLHKGMLLFGFINMLGDHGAKQVDELNAFQNKRVKFACDKYVDFLLYHLSDLHH
jgi:snRNA-activating protein complex subunit 1